MNTKQQAIARKHLDRKLDPLRTAEVAMPPRGWMKAIREALGMTSRQLAGRMRVSASRVPAIEKAEITGSTTIRTLREAAEAMDCKFVYAFVPIKPLDDILKDQIARKVDNDMGWINHTMRLENQAVSPSDVDDERKRLINDTLSGSLRGLWDER
jgi:predicted DNA-binding mobile mystery protein A